MVKKYFNNMQQEENNTSVNPSAAVINQLLNYSKSLEVKKMKNKRVLVNLN
jgi:hypothetical protein